MSNYLAVVRSDNNKVTQRVIVHKPEEMNDEQVKKAIQAIFKGKSEAEKLSLRSVTFYCDNTDVLSYSIGNDQKQWKLNLPAGQVSLKVDLQVLRGHAFGALRKISFFNRYCAVVKKWPIWIIGINIIWALIIVPLVVLYRVLKRNKAVEKEIDARLNRWEQAGTATDMNSMLAALEESLNLLPPQLGQGDNNEKLHQQIEFALNLGRRIQNGASHDQVARDTARNLIDEFNNKREDGVVMAIPTGYYRDGQFYPMLLSFYRKDGQLHLEKLTADPLAMENSQSKKVSFRFDAPGEDQLTDLLKILWKLQAAPTVADVLKESVFQKVATIQKLALFDGNPMEGGRPASQLPMHHVVDDLIGVSGGVMEQTSLSEAEGKQNGAQAPEVDHAVELINKKRAKNNSWSILSHWIRNSFTEIPEAEKAILLKGVLSYHLHLVKSKIDAGTMSADEQARWFPLVKKEIEKFKKVVNKAFGAADSYQYLKEQDQVFAEIDHQIAQIEAAIKQFEQASKGEELQQFQKDMQKTSSSDFGVALVVEKDQVSENLAPKGKSDPSTAFDQVNQLKTIKEKIHAGNFKEAIKVFQGAAAAADSLANVGDWEQAIFLARAAMKAVEVPNHKDQKNIWNLLPKEELDPWSRSVEVITKVLWEGKLRLYKERRLLPEDRVALFKGRAIIYMILFRKCEALFEKVQKKILEQPQEKQNDLQQRFDDLLSTVVGEIIKTDNIEKDDSCYFAQFSQFCRDLGIEYQEVLDAAIYGSNASFNSDFEEWLQLERYLPSIDPEIHQELSQIRAFFTTNHWKHQNHAPVYLEDRMCEPTRGYDKQYLRKLDIVRMIYGGDLLLPPAARSKKDYDNIEKYDAQVDEQYFAQIRRNPDAKPYSKPKEGEAPVPLPLMPTSMIDLRRHQVMIYSLLEYDLLMVRNVDMTIMGGMGLMSWGVEALSKFAAESETPEEVAQKLCAFRDADMQKILLKMGRLEFDVVNSFIGLEAIGAGVHVPAHVKIVSATPAKDSLAAKGLSYIVQLNVIIERVVRREIQRNYEFQQSAVGTVDPELTKNLIHTEDRIPERNVVRLRPIHQPVNAYQYTTEGTALQQALRVEQRPANDHYLLSSLQVQGPVVSMINPSSSPIEALDLVCQRVDLLNNEEYQRAIEIALFKPDALPSQLSGIPQLAGFFQSHFVFFESRAAIIKRTIEQAIRADNDRAVAFLMHIGDRVRRFALSLHAQEQDNAKKANLKKIADLFPGYHSEYIVGGNAQKTGINILLDALQHEEKPHKFLMTYILDWFSKTEQPLEVLSKDKELMATLLMCYSTIRNVGVENGIYAVQKQAMDWIQYILIPHLSTIDDKEMNIILSNLCQRMVGEVAAEPWVRKKGSFIYVSGKCVVDLTRGLIKVGRQEAVGPRTMLPSELRIRREFTDHFGELKPLAYCSPGDSINESLFTFTLENGKTFRLIYNKESDRITVMRWVEPETSGLSKPEWFAYHPVEGENPLNAGMLLKKHGIWKRRKGRQALTFVKLPAEERAQDVYRVKLSRSLKPYQIYQVNPETGERWNVCQDAAGAYGKWFSFAKPEEVLFLSRNGGSAPDEIRFLTHQLVLRKESDRWTVVQGKHKGYSFNALGASKSLLKQFLHSLGQAGKEVLLPLSNGKEGTILLWPHLFSGTQAEFQAEDKEILPSLLEVKITENGEIKSSTAGFMYLAYLYFMQGDTKRAYHYLNKAGQARLVDGQDTLHFNRILENLRKKECRNTRQIAFLLKAELMAAKIRREQIGQPGYAPERTSDFIANASHICKLFNAYNLRMDGLLKSNPKALIEEDLLLTAQEKHEFQTIRLEALDQLFTNVIQPEHLQLRPPHDLSTARSEGRELFWQHVIIFMASPDPRKAPTENLLDLTELSHENVLRYFFHYAKQIVDNKIPVKDLQHLLAIPMRKVENDDPAIADIQNSVMAARDFLLNLAENPGSIASNAPFFDVKQLMLLYKKKEKMSGTLVKETGSCCLLKCIRLIQTGLNLYKMYGVAEASKGIIDSARGALGGAGVRFNVVHQSVPATRPSPVNVAQLNQAINEAVGRGIVSQEEQLNLYAAVGSLDQVPPAFLSSTASTREGLLAFLKPFLPVDLVEPRRLACMMTRIDQRLERIKAAAANPVKRAYSEVHVPKMDENRFYRELFFTRKVDAKKASESVDKAVSEYDKVFTDDRCSPMEKHENEQLKEGMAIAGKTLKEQLAASKTIAKNSLPLLKSQIAARLGELENRYKELRTAILEWAETDDAPVQLNKMMAQRDIYGDAEILEKALDLYLKGKLKRLEKESVHGCRQITEFLLISTERQQYQKAQKEMEKLFALAKARSDAKDEQTKDPLRVEYRYIANNLFQLLEAGASSLRYFDENNCLKEQQLTRKYLVAEHRSGMILRENQIKMILQIYQNPNSLNQLRMGLGKTSMIFPIVMQLLAERGHYTVGLVTEELINMHYDALNHSTREFYRQAGMRFTFDINGPDSPAFLAELYDSLLAVKEEEDYLVTSVEQLAPLQNKIVANGDQITTLVAQMHKLLSAGNIQKFNEMAPKVVMLKQQQMWLCRIDSLFNTQGNDRPFTTQIFADEGDDIFDVRKEINQALSQHMRNVNPDINRAAKNVMMLILQNHEKDEKNCSALDVLKKAIINKRQSALTSNQVNNGLHALARLIYKKEELGKFHVSLADWVDYVTGQTKELPPGFPNNDEMHRLIGPYKRMLAGETATLKNVLKMALGIDMGTRQADGCVVVPFSLKQEKPRTQFGDEYELLLNHYVAYAALGPTDKFLSDGLKKLACTDAECYQRIIKKAAESGLEILEFLRGPNSWEERLEIFEKLVIDGGYLKLAEEQITLIVHHLIQGRNCGIASGTLDPASLPKVFSDQAEGQNTRTVEAETFIQMAMGEQATKIVEDSELLHTMAEALSDKQLRAIINQGVALDGRSTLEIIASLRESDEGQTRQFIFIHPLKRKPYMWQPNEPAPVPFEPEKLDARKCLFYFDPADTRGVDFRMPPGKIVMIPGPTTTQEAAVQAAYRARQLGTVHKMSMWVLASVAKRIQEDQGVKKEEITLHREINDIKKKTLESAAIMHLKTAITHIQGLLFVGAKKICFPNDIQRHKPEYWQNQQNLAIDMQVDDILFKVCRGLFIQNKKPIFAADFHPTEEIDVLDKLRETYDEQLKKIVQIKEAIKSHAKAIPFYMPGRDQVLLRLKNAKQQFNALIEQFGVEIRKFETKAEQEKWRKQLPAKAEKGHGIETQASQVQVQVQQQQQQQQQQVRKIIGKTDPYASKIYEPPSLGKMLRKGIKLPQHDHGNLHAPEAGLDFVDSGLDKLACPLYVTSEVAKLFRNVPLTYQFPYIRFAIFYNPFSDIPYRVCLIGKNDYYNHCNEAEIQRSVDHAEDLEGAIWGVYSMDTSATLNRDEPVGLWPVTSKEISLNNDDLVLTVAIARLLMGCEKFTKAEQQAIKQWKLNDYNYAYLEKNLAKKASIKTLEALRKMRKGITV